MRPFVAALALIWGLFTFAVSFFMISNVFVAKTVIKEGVAAQAALLLGGITIEVLAVVLIWQSARIVRGR